MHTVVEAFNRYVGLPTTATLDKFGCMGIEQSSENIRWARGHVDDEGAAALLAATALSGNGIADISGVRDWTFSSVIGD